MFHRPRIEEPESRKSGREEAAKGETAVQEKEEAKAKAPNPPAKEESKKVETVNKAEEEKMSNKEEQQEKPQAARPIDIPGQAHMKPYQPPRAPATGYGYPGAMGGGTNVYGSSQSAPSADRVSSGRRLVIGEGITMSGEIESCDHLLVEGTVEAALKGASVLELAESGVFYGTVEIDEATISGRFEGDITVNGRLTVTMTGSITGSIAYKELAVESGATLDGKITPLSVKNAGAGVKKGDSKSKEAKGKSVSRSDSGNELPFGGNAAAASEMAAE